MEQSLSAASPAGGYDAIPNGKNRKRHDSTKAPIGLSGSNLALAGYPAGGHISPAPGAPGNAGKPAPECDGQVMDGRATRAGRALPACFTKCTRMQHMCAVAIEGNSL